MSEDDAGRNEREVVHSVDALLAGPILAAPIILDLAQRARTGGIQEWLSFYFKSPITLTGLYPEHDLLVQQMKLENTLRATRGGGLIPHLDLDRYE